MKNKTPFNPFRYGIWVLLLFSFLTGFAFSGTFPGPSLSGVVVREALRIMVWSLKSRGAGIIDTGNASAQSHKQWKAPWGFSHTKYIVQGVPVELLVKKRGTPERVILLLHGGAYLMGLVDIYRDLGVRYSTISGGASVALVDYRIAPEHTFPAALEDAEAVWNWLLEQGYREENIIVVGDSAGGNLSLALALKLRDEKRKMPKAIVCMSPWTDMTASGDSYRDNLYKDPIFGLFPWEKPTGNGQWIGNLYIGGHPLDDPYLSPAFGDYRGFPPMLIQVGALEIIESDSLIVYERAKAAGVDVTLTRYEGMFHVFQLFGDFVPEVREAWEEVTDFLRWQFRR